MEQIARIKVKNIYPHPDNPRQNIGDISELVESVKKNGIMQNLTVIPIDALTKAKEEQTHAENISLISNFHVLIGHRRLAAARQAGLTEVPCRIISNISRKEQIAIMLEENMQRNDLSIVEQGQGFQMMLDLGETKEGIAEITGFSKSTIEHRLNIARLDKDILEKKQESFQISLKDLYELEKIKDVNERNRILKEATRSDELVWKTNNYLAAEKREKTAKLIIGMLEDAGLQPFPKREERNRYSNKYEYVKYYNLDNEPPKRIPKTYSGHFYYKEYRGISVYKKAEKKEMSEQQKKQNEIKVGRQKIKAINNEINSQMKEFVKTVILKKKLKGRDSGLYSEAAWNILFELETIISESTIIKFFSGKYTYEMSEEEKKEARSRIDNTCMYHQMLILIVEESRELTLYSGEYNEKYGKILLKKIDLLESYGFSLPDELMKAADGTHELYVKTLP